MNCNLSATGIRCPKLYCWCTWRDRLSRQRVTWELNGKHSFYRHDVWQEYILVLFSYIALSRHSDSRFCITQSRFCVTHVCFVDFVTYFCIVMYKSFYITNYPAHIIAFLSRIVLHIVYKVPLYQTFSFLHYAFLRFKLYVTHGSYLSMYNSSCMCHTLLF